MLSIGNSCFKSITFKKVVTGIVCVAAIGSLAIAVIGLIAPAGDSFKDIVQVGTTSHEILLGTSFVVLILALLKMKDLSKTNQAKAQTTLPSLASVPTPSPSLAPVPTQAPYQQPDIMLEISLSFLDFQSLFKSLRVNKQWRHVGNHPRLWQNVDLRKISPKLRVFDEIDWGTYVDLTTYQLDMSDAQPLNKRVLIPNLLRLISSLPIERDAGLTVLTIPRGLTLKKLRDLSQNPQHGNHFTNSDFTPGLIDELDWFPVDHTYRIVISNNVLIGSRNQSDQCQIAFAREFGSQMPRYLEAISHIVTTYMHSGEHLYGDSPRTYTRCSAPIHGKYLVAGSFGSRVVADIFGPPGIHVWRHIRSISQDYGVAYCMTIT